MCLTYYMALGQKINTNISPATADRVFEHILNTDTDFRRIIADMEHLSLFSMNFASYSDKVAMRVLTNPIDFNRVVKDGECLDTFMEHFPKYQELAKKIFQDKEVRGEIKNNTSSTSTSPNSPSNPSIFSSASGQLYPPARIRVSKPEATITNKDEVTKDDNDCVIS